MQSAPPVSTPASAAAGVGGPAPFGIALDAIPTTFNLFMNAAVDGLGVLSIGPPRSRPGDAGVLRAEMDLIIGLTACSAEKSNNGRCKLIDYQVLLTDRDIRVLLVACRPVFMRTQVLTGKPHVNISLAETIRVGRSCVVIDGVSK